MDPKKCNLDEHKPAETPAADDSWDDDDRYQRRQEHGRGGRRHLSDEVRDRRAYLDRVL